MQNVQEIREKLIEKLDNNEYVIDKTGVKTIEIVGESFTADEPTIFGEPNTTYIEKEKDWYWNMDMSVYGMDNPPKIWKDVASEHGFINSNYGFLIYHPANHLQYINALKALKADKNSRRSIMIYTRPSMQYEFNKDGMSDFICTNTVQLLIRDNKLDYIVNMRSNDVIFGYSNDYAWHKFVYDNALDNLKTTYKDLKEGKIIWQVGSLHVYERHFKKIKEWNNQLKKK